MAKDPTWGVYIAFPNIPYARFRGCVAAVMRVREEEEFRRVVATQCLGQIDANWRSIR